MTTPEKSNQPPSDKDILAGLEFDAPVTTIDDMGQTWLPISFDIEKDRLVGDLFDHIDTLVESQGELDPNDHVGYLGFARNIETIMNQSADLDIDDLVQFDGLGYIIQDGEAYLIPEGTILRGKYRGMLAFPYFVVGPDDQMIEMLPIGINFAITDLHAATPDGPMELPGGIPVGRVALLTLHGLDTHIHKLEPVITA